MKYTKPLLEIFTTTYNMESSIKEFIDFYRNRVPNCNIMIYDNMSVDNTVNICRENNVNTVSFDTQGKMDEKTLIEIRNNCWKNSQAEFIIVCDSDEFVTITEKELLEATWNISKCKGIELFEENWMPIEEYTEGLFSEGYSKKVLFKKNAIQEMNFAPGSHSCSPIPKQGIQLIWNENPPFLLHGKWRSWENGRIRQNEMKIKGVSEDSKRKGWNFHYSLPDSDHRNYFMNGINNKIKFK